MRKTFYALRYLYRKRLARLDSWTERVMHQPGRYDESQAPQAPNSFQDRHEWKRMVEESAWPTL